MDQPGILAFAILMEIQKPLFPLSGEMTAKFWSPLDWLPSVFSFREVVWETLGTVSDFSAL